MDVTPTHQDPATGDDELAKVLAGVTDDPSAAVQTPNTNNTAGLQFEETPKATKTNKSEEPTAAPTPTAMPATTLPEPAPALSKPEETTPDLAVPALPTPTAESNGLDDIKKNALEELRPLVDKLNLPPEEKFDTLLLIIRSTDDRSLVATAHEAAKAITDEAKRAQALLDVIKEIDYFSTQNAS